MPEAINPLEGYTANWNGKASVATTPPTGREFRHIFILERLGLAIDADRDVQPPAQQGRGRDRPREERPLPAAAAARRRGRARGPGRSARDADARGPGGGERLPDRRAPLPRPGDRHPGDPGAGLPAGLGRPDGERDLRRRAGRDRGLDPGRESGATRGRDARDRPGARRRPGEPVALAGLPERRRSLPGADRRVHRHARRAGRDSGSGRARHQQLRAPLRDRLPDHDARQPRDLPADRAGEEAAGAVRRLARGDDLPARAERLHPLRGALRRRPARPEHDDAAPDLGGLAARPDAAGRRGPRRERRGRRRQRHARRLGVLALRPGRGWRRRASRTDLAIRTETGSRTTRSGLAGSDPNDADTDDDGVLDGFDAAPQNRQVTTARVPTVPPTSDRGRGDGSGTGKDK